MNARGFRRLAAIFLAWSLAGFGHAAERVDLVWPTPNPAWAAGRPSAEFLQHAGSGEPESGGFGGVRSGGARFHEGIDIKCVARDRSGEPIDSVFAAMKGVVRYINPNAGESGYGRYIILEHPDVTPAVYTLYAHLARIGAGLRVGDTVSKGQPIAVMGHSSGGYMIPRDRAHLHFEIGLALTRDFQKWYDQQRFGSHNDHSMWNGMNLVGIDPLAFFNEWRAGRVNNFQEFLAQMPTAVRLRIATVRTPDFVTRYPALLTKPLPMGPVAGWEIRFNWTGLPVSWTPLSSTEIVGLVPERPRIVEVDADAVRRQRSRSVAVQRRGEWTTGRDLDQVLQLLFGHH